MRERLEETQSKSTVWKAQANGMIVQLTNDLREKDATFADLQKKLDEVSKERKVVEIASERDEALEIAG